MTASEAIERIDEVLDSEYHYDETLGYQLTSDDFEWLETAKQALEKQIPEVPVYKDVGNVYGALERTCSVCGDICMISESAKPYERYCRYCGNQLENWSDMPEGEVVDKFTAEHFYGYQHLADYLNEEPEVKEVQNEKV